MKYQITTNIEVVDGVSKILNTTIIPITNELGSIEVVQGKQEPVQRPAPPQRVPVPAPVGQKPTQGKGDWFAGTSWGN